MAVKTYALANVDKNKQNVTMSVGTSDGTNGVRVIVDDAFALTEVDVLVALEVITQRIREDTWPLS
jgi:hypothetical protein